MLACRADWLEDPTMRSRMAVMVNKLRLLPQMVASVCALDSDDRVFVDASCAASGLVGLLCESRGWQVKAFLWAAKPVPGQSCACMSLVPRRCASLKPSDI